MVFQGDGDLSQEGDEFEVRRNRDKDEGETIVDKAGKVVFQGYDKITTINKNGEAVANIGSKYYLLNINGNNKQLNLDGYKLKLNSHIYADPKIDNLLIYEKDGKYGLIDLNGNIIIRNKYIDIDYILNDNKEVDGFQVYNNQGLTAIIDKNDKIIVPFQTMMEASSVDKNTYSAMVPGPNGPITAYFDKVSGKETEEPKNYPTNFELGESFIGIIKKTAEYKDGKYELTYTNQEGKVIWTSKTDK
jgi:hypothetical protein